MTLAEQIHKEGMQKGMQEGIIQGSEQGASAMQYSIARNMIKEHFSIEQINKISGMSMQNIKQIAEEIEK